MTDNWLFFPCAMGDDEAFIYLNVGLSDSIQEAPPTLVKLQLQYKSPRPNGLPTNDEFEPVNQIEDRISEHAQAHGDWYVGRVTVAGHRYFHVYTTQAESAWMVFIRELCHQSGYQIRLAYRDDAEHRSYLDDLYPRPDDWQVIKDMAVIENLKKHGDDGSQARNVDHWAYFASETAAADFIAWAEGDRFRHEAEYSHPTDDGRYCVRLSHQGTIELFEISNHTIALRQKAQEYGGDYDGWETQILKPED